jgi:DGQHR domain-containing protein
MTEASMTQHDAGETRLRYSVSLVRQGNYSFYTLTMPSNVLAETCVVSTRKEDPKQGFQRTLDEKRAIEIAQYVDTGKGTIPNSIVLSAQPAAKLKIVGGGKTLEFSKTAGAFLILDGQHRVYGFSLSKADTPLRVPVVIYNGLSRTDESRLFIDINTKQRPVPSQLLLDIKQLADIEDAAEANLREIFDLFNSDLKSVMAGKMAPFESLPNKITRVTFNAAVKPLLELLAGRDPAEIFRILNSYFVAISNCVIGRTKQPVITKPVVFRAFVGLFPSVAQRVHDKFDAEYTAEHFAEFLGPIFAKLPAKKLESPGTSWVELKDYLEKRLREKTTL